MNAATASNASSYGSVALTLDQTQLQQITQLMNEMQQQDMQFNGACESSSAGQTVAASAGFSIDVDNQAEHQAQLVFSPDSIVKLESQIHFQPQQQQQQQQPHTIFMPQSNHLVDTQAQMTQVHTIMLNGQPALFIPASSAMSSNLLSQMLMNNSNSANSGPASASDTASSSSVRFENGASIDMNAFQTQSKSIIFNQYLEGIIVVSIW